MFIEIRNILRNAKKRSVALVAFLFFIFPSTVFSANLTVSPSSVKTNVGKNFSVDIVVNNNIDSINAVSALLDFPEDALQVVSISKTGSFITLWAEEPNFSNKNGTVSLEGVALNPGYDKATGKVLTVNFKALQAGNVSVSVKSGSVLANDGNATDVLRTTGAAFVYINEEEEENTPVKKEVKETLVPVITSPTHPDSNLWYSRRDTSFEWKLPQGVTAVRTVYSEKETDTPSKVYDPPISNRSFTTDADGVFYMAVQFRNVNGWGAVTRYKFQIDTEAPQSLKASFPDGPITTNQTPAVLILAEDKLSQVAKITMSVDNGKPVEFAVDPSNLYRLPKQPSGNHTVVITVIDNAGNASTVSLDYTIQTITPPVITEYTKKVDFDTPFRISGATYPQSIIEIELLSTEGEKVFMQATSSDHGAFSFTSDRKISAGVYEMRARVSDGRGSLSDYTETKVVIVEQTAFVKFGMFIMNWLSVILILILTSATIVATLWYAIVQFNRFRRKVRRNLAEVENTLHANVQALKKDTEEFHDILVKAERKRELTKEETAILKKFKKRLEITEREIEKKLEKAV